MKKKWVAGAGLIKLISLHSPAFFVREWGGCSPKPIQEEKTVDTQVLRVGIISDTQLAPKGGSDVYDSYLKGALELLKQKDDSYAHPCGRLHGCRPGGCLPKF